MPTPRVIRGKRYSFRSAPPERAHLEFWAENGFVHVLNVTAAENSENTADDYSRELDPKEFYKRAVGLAVMTRDYADEQFWVLRFLDNAERVAREALAQDATIRRVVKHGIFGDRATVPADLRAEPPEPRPQLILPPDAKPQRKKRQFARQTVAATLMDGIKYQ